MVPMETRMEIQGRKRVPLRGGIVRDDVRHGSSTSTSEAQKIAQRFAAEGFTVWIFQVKPGTGISPSYRAVAMLAPDAATIAEDLPDAATVKPRCAT